MGSLVNIILFLCISIPILNADIMPWYELFMFEFGIVSIVLMLEERKAKIESLEREIRLLRSNYFHLEDKLSEGFFWPTGAINNLDFKGEA